MRIISLLPHRFLLVSLISLTLTFFSVLKVPLEARLREIYAPRPDKVLFVKADGEVIYQKVITATDAARGARRLACRDGAEQRRGRTQIKVAAGGRPRRAGSGDAEGATSDTGEQA